MSSTHKIQSAVAEASTRSANLAPGRTLDVALVVIRLGLLIVFFAHGAQKLFGAFGGGGVSGTAAFFAALGAHPGTFWAVLGGVVEFFGALAVGLGLLTRLAAIGLALDMVGAIVLTSGDHGFFAEKAGGGWEINLILWCMSVALVLVGAGRYGVDGLLRPALGRRSRFAARVL
jgi:putative oxidoreductase